MKLIFTIVTTVNFEIEKRRYRNIDFERIGF